MSERIIWDTAEEIPPRDVIGTKAYNLMLMKRAGFPIPRFFTLLGNRPSGKPLEQEVIDSALSIGEDLILRSCHPLESGKHPFSGKFMSEWCPARDDNIQQTYSEILKSASDEEVRKYIEKNRIEGFDPNAMNVIFMKEFPHRFFAMYMTAAQDNPSEMIVNYYDSIERRGRWEVFDKITKKQKSETWFEKDNRVAVEAFGLMGIQTEEFFKRHVQLEVAINKENVLQVFQAKDIALTDPLSLAKPSEYKTMITGLHGQGYTSFRGPVLILDEAHKAYPKTEFGDREIMKRYKSDIEEFMSKNPKYILVLKELKDFLRGEESSNDWRMDNEERYSYLNRVVKNSVVQIRSKAQSVVRHESWDNIEKGGAIVFVDYDHIQFEDRFVHKSRNPEQPALEPSFGRESVWMRSRELTPVTIVNRYEINTGDELEVLCNEDGVFIW